MTPDQIATARALVALGLPVPTFLHVAIAGDPDDSGTVEWEYAPGKLWECDLEIGDTCRPFGCAPSAGLLFKCVATDEGMELLPALDDWALLGWLIAELERATGDVCDITEIGYELGMSDDYPKNWKVHVDKYEPVCAPTRIEALTIAIEIAKAKQ